MRIGEKQHIILGHLEDIKDNISIGELHDKQCPEIGFKRLDATVDSVTRLELKGLVRVKWNEKTQNSNPHVRTSIVSITDKGREVLDAEDKRNGCNIHQYA